MDCKITKAMKKMAKSIETGTHKVLAINDDLVLRKSPRYSLDENAKLLSKAFHILGYSLCNTLDMYQLLLETILFLIQYREPVTPYKIHCMASNEDIQMYFRILVKMIQYGAAKGEILAEYVTKLDNPEHYMGCRLLVLDLANPIEFPKVWSEHHPSLIIIGDMWFNDKFADTTMSHLVLTPHMNKKGIWEAGFENLFCEEKYFKVFVSSLRDTSCFVEDEILTQHLKSCNLSPEYISMRLSRLQRWQDKFLWELISDSKTCLEGKLYKVARVFRGESTKFPNQMIIVTRSEMEEHFHKHYQGDRYQTLDSVIPREFPFLMQCGDQYVMSEFLILNHFMFNTDAFVCDYFTKERNPRRWLYSTLVQDSFLFSWDKDCSFKTKLREFHEQQIMYDY